MTSKGSLDRMPLCVETLAQAVREGDQPSYLSFPDWGGAPPLGWLVPWSPTPFETSAGRSGSGEHHFMHGKALLFGDRAMAARILRATSAGQARALGRHVSGFSRAVVRNHDSRF